MAATNFGSVLQSTAESDVILITQKRMRVSFCLLAWFWLVALAIPSQAQNSEYSRFQNRWKPDQYLNVEHGQIESGRIASSDMGFSNWGNWHFKARATIGYH